MTFKKNFAYVVRPLLVGTLSHMEHESLCGLKEGRIDISSLLSSPFSKRDFDS